MHSLFKKQEKKENKFYNEILLLSRNKALYTKLYLKDTFQNRINLIFFHFSFMLTKLKLKKFDNNYNSFYQKTFDLIFKNIEINMRELGQGDVSVNKNMKFLVKIFYNILLNCETYSKKKLKDKNAFLCKYLVQNDNINTPYNDGLVDYFDKYESFCFDLKPDSVLEGDLIFNYE